MFVDCQERYVVWLVECVDILCKFYYKQNKHTYFFDIRSVKVTWKDGENESMRDRYFLEENSKV